MATAKQLNFRLREYIESGKRAPLFYQAMAEVHIIGQILEATNFDDRSLFCKFTINSGPNWKALEGFLEGQTHLSAAASGDGTHSWAHPIDIHYVTRGLQGWPRIEYQVWDVDWIGKCNVSAYGFMSVPMQPGFHQLTCPTWRPVGNFRRRLLDHLTGYRMHLVDPSNIIGNGLRREAIQSVSMGEIKAELTVVLRGFENFNIDV